MALITYLWRHVADAEIDSAWWAVGLILASVVGGAAGVFVRRHIAPKWHNWTGIGILLFTFCEALIGCRQRPYITGNLYAFELIALFAIVAVMGPSPAERNASARLD